MNISIHQANVADIATIAKFQIGLALETENISLDPETVTIGVQKVLEDESKGKYYVACVENTVVGCLLTTFEWSDWRNSTVLWIQSVYVVQEYRNQGVYSKLYAHIRNLVETSANYSGIRLYVDLKNERAQKVYSALSMNGDHYKIFEWMKYEKSINF